MSRPSVHLLRAAAIVVRILDGRACNIELARGAYRTLSTGGEHSSIELARGEDLLVQLRVLTRTSRTLRPADWSELALHVLPEGEIVDVLRELAGAANAGSSARALPDFLAALGAAGEEAVERACRVDLAARGAHDLARAVERVSLISDHFGFDVRAPRIGGAPRLLEVKTQIGHGPAAFRFHLTRNEYDVGRDEPTWSVVVCTSANRTLNEIEIGGWCSADALRPYLPNDGHGRWMEALVVLPRSALRGGLPSAVSE